MATNSKRKSPPVVLAILEAVHLGVKALAVKHSRANPPIGNAFLKNTTSAISAVRTLNTALSPEYAGTIVQEVFDRYGDSEAARLFREVFTEHHPNKKLDWTNCSRPSDFIVAWVLLIRESYSASNHTSDMWQSLEGDWLEIITTGEESICLSVGSFFFFDGALSYSGTAYTESGDPDYFWDTSWLGYDRINQRFVYSYTHRDASDCKTNGDGFGAIRVRPTGQDSLMAIDAYFVDLLFEDEANKVGATSILPRPKRCKMERLMAGLQGLGYEGNCPVGWSEINKVISDLCKRPGGLGLKRHPKSRD